MKVLLPTNFPGKRCFFRKGRCVISNGILILGFILVVGGFKAQAQVWSSCLNEGWSFHEIDSPTIYPAVVPGSIHNDLLMNDLIPDPYFRDNARYLGWIDSTIWVYTNSFEWPMDWPEDASVSLIFEGLDTYTDLYINEKHILKTDNMFKAWHVELDPVLKGKPISLRLIFQSSVLEGNKRSKAVSWTYPADSDPFPGKPSVFTRKAAYQFGWDFAPPLPGCGIWKPVRLEGRRGPQLDNWWLETVSISADKALVRLNGKVTDVGDKTSEIHWKIGPYTGKELIKVKKGTREISIPIEIPSPKLWWPKGEGEPNLYSVTVHFETLNGISENSFKAGIRTIALIREPDSFGTSFQFVVNGRKVFCQGANWVPPDMFPGRVTDQHYRDLVALAAEAGMNMLRIWGGGIYERDLFYQLADSLGIMIWQDFMFAGTMYPGDADFFRNVNEEARFQIERLRHHPSIALWCGNNEIEVAWENWGWPKTYGYSKRQQRSMERDYRRLFHHLLPGAVNEFHPGADYLSSSPVSNWGDRSDLDHGNNHFWGVWHGEMALDSLRTRIPRFISEYGMPSFPTWESIVAFSLPEDQNIDSEVMAFRQRSYKGNGLIKKYIESEKLPQPSDFRQFVAASHTLQSRALEIAIQAHQKDYPRCAGTLLWQFNEPWPGVSWAIIDHYGRPKPAYETVKRLYLRHKH